MFHVSTIKVEVQNNTEFNVIDRDLASFEVEADAFAFLKEEQKKTDEVLCVNELF
jgi:hypothetical protein